MNRPAMVVLLTLLFSACAKPEAQSDFNAEESEAKAVAACDMAKVYADNAAKVTISSGIWGTVASMEGNCMPLILPGSSTCRTCPVRRTVRIYEYTTLQQADAPGMNIFYNSFTTRLVKSIDTDNDGFFQAAVPAGKYTIAVVENGKLYAFGHDGQGGISPLEVSAGLQQANLLMTYKAAF